MHFTQEVPKFVVFVLLIFSALPWQFFSDGRFRFQIFGHCTMSFSDRVSHGFPYGMVRLFRSLLPSNISIDELLLCQNESEIIERQLVSASAIQ